MDTRHKRIVYWLVAIVLVFALVPPIVWGAPRNKDGTGGDPWRNTILDFQTLITGVFAIAAAYGTIRQMQETDRKQEVRHERQIYLDRRREMISAHRFVEKIAPKLVQFSLAAETFKLHTTEGEVPIWTSRVTWDYFQMMHWVRELSKTLAMVSPLETELLTAETETKVNSFRDLLETAAKSLPETDSDWHDLFYKSGDTPPTNFDPHFLRYIFYLAQDAENLAPKLEDWFATLQRDFGW